MTTINLFNLKYLNLKLTFYLFILTLITSFIGLYIDLPLKKYDEVRFYEKEYKFVNYSKYKSKEKDKFIIPLLVEEKGKRFPIKFDKNGLIYFNNFYYSELDRLDTNPNDCTIKILVEKENFKIIYLLNEEIDKFKCYNKKKKFLTEIYNDYINKYLLSLEGQLKSAEKDDYIFPNELLKINFISQEYGNPILFVNTHKGIFFSRNINFEKIISYKEVMKEYDNIFNNNLNLINEFDIENKKLTIAREKIPNIYVFKNFIFFTFLPLCVYIIFKLIRSLID